MTMNNRIESLSDLQAERARLKNQLETSRVGIRRQFDDIKEDINPARQIVQTFTHLMSKPKNNALQMGVVRGIDMALAYTPIGRMAWPLRFIIRFLLKRATANYLSSNQNHLLQKSLSWVKEVSDDEPKVVRITEGKPKKHWKERFFRWLKDATAEDDIPRAHVVESLPLAQPERPVRTPL